MLRAKKANKVLTIDEAEEKTYQTLGYDIYTVDSKGKEELKAHGAGKTVPIAKYEALEKELEELKAAQKK